MNAVLLQIDPGQAISVAKDLGGATPQTILAFWAVFATIFGGLIGWRLWKALDQRTAAHMAAVEKCHDSTLDITVKNIEAQNRMSEALDGNSNVMKAALEALKK
jgi:hypothetical protein